MPRIVFLVRNPYKLFKFHISNIKLHNSSNTQRIQQGKIFWDKKKTKKNSWREIDVEVESVDCVSPAFPFIGRPRFETPEK